MHSHSEEKIRIALALTFAAMVGEIVAGLWFGSMAVLAEGWHMSTHVAALGGAAFAAAYARRHHFDPRFPRGTAKVGALGGFASAVVLGVVGLLVLGESISRLWSNEAVAFDEAIAVACVGFGVNLINALVLRVEHHHLHDGVVHAHGPGEADHNLRGAHLHVLSDAMLSAFAIAALVLGRIYGWHWTDPFMGIAGALVIARWAVRLIRDTSPILLDAAARANYTER